MKPADSDALIAETFDSERVLQSCRRIVRSDAEFTFPAFHRTARTAAAIMRNNGLTDVEVHRFKADGRQQYGDWTVPRAWDVKQAVLAVRDADGRLQRIADRDQDLCSIMMYSAPTPGCRPLACAVVSARRRKLWPGNLVFLEHPGEVSLAELASGGARGVVNDYMPLWKDCRTREDVYDICLWNNGYLAPANQYGMIGFQLAPRSGDRLRSLLRRGRGRVEARAHVDARLYDGAIDFVTGLLKGTDPRAGETAVFAHLYEVGAHDNASGCAVGLEAVRSIGRLADAGRIPRPRRGIRLCFMFEVHGTLAYFERFPERARPIVAAINPDMVGADMERIRSRLHVHGTPDSAPSYTDALIAGHIGRTFKRNYLFRWNEEPFCINDNFITDPSIGIPCPALISLRDTFYHSSGDVVANLHPESIAAVGTAVTGYLYDIARGDADTAERLADAVLARELEAVIRKDRTCPGGPAAMLIDYRAMVARNRLASIHGFTAGRQVPRRIVRYLAAGDRMITSLARARRQQAPAGISAAWRKILKPPAALVKEARRIFPVKKVIGTYTYTGLPADEQPFAPGNGAWNYSQNAPVFWADGTRSIFDIWQCVCCEQARPRPLEQLVEFFAFLRRNGFVWFRPR